jgi:putative PIN family toxin of toxin-antitoxin system
MPAHRIVLDTNVLISAVLFGGKPRDLVRLVSGGAMRAFLSPAMLRELQDVLARPKFRLAPDLVQAIVEQVQLSVTMVYPQQVVRVVDADPDDDAVIACAVAADADFLITGDTHLLALQTHQDIEIVSPEGYFSRFIAGPSRFTS